MGKRNNLTLSLFYIDSTMGLGGASYFAMKVYDPKTAIANRLRGQVFSINNENDERTMLSEIISVR